MDEINTKTDLFPGFQTLFSDVEMLRPFQELAQNSGHESDLAGTLMVITQLACIAYLDHEEILNEPGGPERLLDMGKEKHSQLFKQFWE